MHQSQSFKRIVRQIIEAPEPELQAGFVLPRDCFLGAIVCTPSELHQQISKKCLDRKTGNDANLPSTRLPTRGNNLKNC